ncbi:MAG: hypothetical protein FWC22_02530 [Treponema sp.]|nr:hypothetical protein [Treponema sp.]
MKKLFLLFAVFMLAASIQSQEKKPFRMGNRVFELGIANFDLGIANNFLTAGDILNKNRKLIIDFENLGDGLNIGFDLSLSPLFFNINIKDKWGFGLDIANISAYGNIDISGELLKLNRSDGDRFGMGASAFLDVGFPLFFHIKNVVKKDLKINLRPAGFVTLFFAEPDMTYTFKEINNSGINSAYMEIDYEAKIYTPVLLDSRFDFFSSLDIGELLGRNLGVDLGIGAEYPLFNWLDLGVNFSHIPVIPSRLNHYVEIKDKISLDTSELNAVDLINGDVDMDKIINLPENNNMVFGTDSKDKYIRRPFKMIFYGNFRPFQSQIFTVTPKLGFSINGAYVQKFSVEGGLGIKLDLANMFITRIGINYEDKMWKNGISFNFNFRAVEIGIGAAMQSQNFLKSWQASGVRVNFEFKLGY